MGPPQVTPGISASVTVEVTVQERHGIFMLKQKAGAEYF